MDMRVLPLNNQDYASVKPSEIHNLSTETCCLAQRCMVPRDGRASTVMRLREAARARLRDHLLMRRNVPAVFLVVWFAAHQSRVSGSSQFSELLH